MDVNASNPKFSQPNFFIGDTVRAVYSLDFAVGEGEAAFCENAGDEITLQGAKITADGKIEVEFAPWKSGQISIPPADLGDFRIFFEPIFVPSICEKMQAAEFRPPLPPCAPYSAVRSLYFCAISAALIFVAAAFFFAKFAKIRKFFQNLQKTIFKSSEYRVFSKNIRKINLKTLDCDNFFTQINRFLREYLEKSLKKPFLSTVSAKIPEIFNEISSNELILSKSDIDFACNLFKTCDLARFSSKKSRTDNFPRILEETKKMALSVERLKIESARKKRRAHAFI